MYLLNNAQQQIFMSIICWIFSAAVMASSFCIKTSPAHKTSSSSTWTWCESWSQDVNMRRQHAVLTQKPNQSYGQTHTHPCSQVVSKGWSWVGKPRFSQCICWIEQLHLYRVWDSGTTYHSPHKQQLHKKIYFHLLICSFAGIDENLMTVE